VTYKLRLLAPICAALGLAGIASADVQSLTAEEAHLRVQRGELILIDVRTASEWAMTGLPRDSVGASHLDADFIAKAKGAVYQDLDQPVALICETGNRSGKAAKRLESEGFSTVFNITEGMSGNNTSGIGWLKKDLPTDPFIPRY
jgi:rhodanese-related sulfurtransferase